MVSSGKVWQSVVQALLATIALVVLTFVAFELHADLTIALCLYVAFIVIIALVGNVALSIVASIVTVGFMDWFFTPPLFSVQIGDPLDAVALALFVLISLSITTLIARLRLRSKQLETARVHLDEQIAARAQTEEFLQQAQDVARVNRVMLVGEMTASIAHEINQPLTGIIANAGTSLRYLAAQPPNLDEARTHLEFIVRDGNRAAGIISRIRALVKRAPPARSMLDINETILDVIALAQVQLQKNPIDVRTDLASDLPQVPADRVQLQQVILNLLVNAVEAMRETNGRSRELVVASGTMDQNKAFVEVRDSGPGLDPANADQLFNAFYTTKPEGMGMGLSISRLIVEGHGGRLWGTSNAPHGAVFRFTLPLTVEERVDA